MAEALPVSGHIDPKSFPFILIDLHRQGATGSLKVEGSHHQKALYFRGGRILFGSSNDPRDQLGAILIESGKLTEQQFEDVNNKVGPGHPLAKALADSGIVSQRELSEAARAKVERILSDVLSYTSGSFEFEDGVLPKGAVDLKLAPERLFLAAVRRISDRSFVLRHLEGLEIVLLTGSALADKLPELEPELAGLAPLLDGQTSLKDVAAQAGVDEFEAAKVACGLIFLGLAEKSAAEIVAEADEASPFFVPAAEAAELDFSQPASPGFDVEDEPPPTIPFGAEAPEIEQTETMPAPNFEGKADETLMMAGLPSFSVPEDPEPEPVEAPVMVSSAAPTPEPEAPPAGPGPLKIIAPPKQERTTRPPSKPTREDLAALDELLGKQAPEGPLASIQKPPEEAWKPQFLPKPTSRSKKTSGFAIDRRMMIAGGVAGIALAGLGAGWSYFSSRAPSQPVAAAPRTQPSVAASRPPVAASAGALASAAPAASGSPAAAGAPAGGPSAPSAQPSVVVVAASPVAPPTPAPAASTRPSVAPTATAPSSRPSSAPAPSKPVAATPAPASGSLDGARASLKKGQFVEAARGFQEGLKGRSGAFTVQILLACSTETIEKALAAVPADDLYILPVHYRGKDCYRMGWGVFDSEAKAGAGSRAVPEYFRQGGAKPKVVSVSELLK